ncbi:probable E3 ubiquitin-protein ligase ZFP1 [Vitis riparia]|uniref:probable E3 ubiquitin-protein ligase ZFP1 n=1 Tax=Vitis riparia TaxID=96939 RepID=UPI00155AF9B3|nr:probable E3 ubiquitin-protein ligase ZFP1 [Vitis riparia]
MFSAPENSSHFDAPHLPQHYDASAMFYGIRLHHPLPSLDIAVAPPSNIYDPYSTPSSGYRGFPVSMNHGPSGHLPSSSNHGVIGVSTYDRKNSQGILGNFQYFNGFASSSSSAPPFNTRHLEFGVPVMDSASFAFAQPQYRGNNAPSIMEVGSHRSVRNRSGAVGLDSVLAHNHYHLVQGNYIGHPFQPSGNPWVDQQSGNNGSGGGTLAWNHGPALPYSHGSNISGGSTEAGNVGIQGYHDTSSARSSTDYLQPPVLHRHHNLHYPPPPPPPPPPMQGARRHFHPQVVASSYRLVTISSRSPVTPQVGVEAGHRHPGPVPPTGIRIDRSHRGGVAPEATSRHGNLPYLRALPEEEVAILDLSASYQVGEVSTGLSEESITNCLKTRTYISSTCLNLEEGASMDEENDSCIICQEEYENEEKIGYLDCGHEYHADCLKKWVLKNVCPLCRAPAMTPKKKDV